MMNTQLITIRLDSAVYRAVLAGDITEPNGIRLWVSVQSLLPIPASTYTAQLCPLTNTEPYTSTDYSRLPILCDRSAYAGKPVARIKHPPTHHTIDLYPSVEWLGYLQSRTPAVYHHNNRYWVYTEYEPERVQQYRELGGQWNNTFRCWVFRTLPEIIDQPVSEIPVFCP